MFILSTLEDNVRVLPHDLGKPVASAITAVLEKTFLDKVVPGLGLVVTLYDILEVSDGLIPPSDGGALYKVRFRVVVLRPFVGELLVGRVTKMDEHGIHASLGFFDDIIIPPHGMPEPTFWHEGDQAWIWKVEGNELFFEKGLLVRFKVQLVNFYSVPTVAEQQEQREKNEEVRGSQKRPYVPMEVVARADGDGLGMAHWYGGDDGEADDDNMQE